MNRKIEGFITFLEKICYDKESGSENKAVLAKLRRCLGKSFDEIGTTRSYFERFLISEAEQQRDLYVLVASLFAKHPELNTTAKNSVGKIHKQMGETDSTEQRFKKLLHAHQGEQFNTHLRHAVQFAQSQGILINYAQLLKDSLNWANQEQHVPVQLQWAIDFWTVENHVNEEEFIKSLEKLDKENTALAKLKRGLGKRFGDIEMYPYVVPFLPKESFKHPYYLLVASLFGMHSSHTPEKSHSMGKVYWQIKREYKDAESVEKRFVALLNAHHDELDYHLRQAVSMAKSKYISINYQSLLKDILDWHHLRDKRKSVQFRWAQDYWKKADTQPKKEEPDETTQML
jgi:CRISPR system Cascade subunit CasB